jgi:hypothetical protein
VSEARGRHRSARPASGDGFFVPTWDGRHGTHRTRSQHGQRVAPSPHHRHPHHDARKYDWHASVEQLSVLVITAIASSCLVNRDTLADINPSFENDTNIVPMPPEKSAFSNCEKVVERDVEVYRKKAQSICMHLGVRSANVVSYNAQFSATIKEQQAICKMFDHRQSNPVRCRAGFGTLRKHLMQRRRYRSAIVLKI